VFPNPTTGFDYNCLNLYLLNGLLLFPDPPEDQRRSGRGGFDPFMNLVLDETIEFAKTGERRQIGMVVVRGNSVVMLEAKDRI